MVGLEVFFLIVEVVFVIEVGVNVEDFSFMIYVYFILLELFMEVVEGVMGYVIYMLNKK